MIKSILKKAIQIVLYKQANKISQSFYKNAIRYNFKLNLPAEGEIEWLKRWRQFDSKLTPMAYRVFSRYIGSNIDIVPLELCSAFIEPILTPSNYFSYYSDKNSFDLLFPNGTLPNTFMRKTRGRYLTRDYVPIDTHEINDFIKGIDNNELIVKPTLSSSGKGVEKFYRTGAIFVNKNNETLSKEFIDRHYKSDCIIQEVFAQHLFFSQFNETSVNSVRIATYRDSRGVIHCLNSFLRIGVKGSIVDNAHAGGMFVGIDKNGKLGKYACDQYGRTQTIFNGIDFSKTEFVIPNWNLICAKVIDLSKYILHHDLIAWDAILDKIGDPHILEVNIGGYGGWAFQFTSGPMFGDYTSDIMESVSQKMKNSELKLSFYRR